MGACPGLDKGARTVRFGRASPRRRAYSSGVDALLGFLKRRRANVAPFRSPVSAGIAMARRLRGASLRGSGERTAALTAFHGSWHEQVDVAFRREEGVLLRVVRDPVHRERLLREHRLLRAMAEEARRIADRGSPDRVWVANLASRLEEHFRWLDSELLPAVERDVDPDRMDFLLREFERLSARH